MKNKSIISILLLGMGLGCGFSSCEDMLTTNSDRKVYIPAQDTLYTYWGIQKCLQNSYRFNLCHRQFRESSGW